MRIAQNAGPPMTRWHVCDGYIPMAVTVPPGQFNDVTKSQVRNQIEHMFRYHDSWRRTTPTFRMLNKSAQRWPMKVIEVSVRDQYQINRRKVVDFHPRLPQALQHE